MRQKFDLKHVYDLEDLKKLQKSGASADVLNQAHAMMAANNKRREKATQQLLSLGFDADPGKIKALLKLGSIPNVWDEAGRTPLHYASIIGEVEMVKCLIDYGAKVNVGDKNDWTPLHYASDLGCTETVKFLVEHGADPDVINKDNDTPLHLAKKNGNDEIVRVLEPLTFSFLPMMFVEKQR